MQQESSLPALLSVSDFILQGRREILPRRELGRSISCRRSLRSKTMYDGTEVSGSEVLNVIRKFSDETMGILVQTNKNKTYYNYNFDMDKGELGKALDNSYKNAQDVASDKYINPTARFQGSIVKDVNGTIIGIVFAQV